MKNKTIKPQPAYSDSFKLGIVMRVANGQLSKEQARVKYKIGGNSSILEWMKKYGYCIEPAIQPAMKKPSDPPGSEELK